MRLRALCEADAQTFVDAMGLSRRVQREVFMQGRLTRETTREVLARNSIIRVGEDVVLTFVGTHAPDPAQASAAHEPADVLWHDRFALAANKPASLLVHSDGTQADTLTARVQATLHRMALEREWPSVPRAQALNRLDVDTTGIVLFSLTEEFQPAFDGLVASHDTARIHKRYLAVVEGDFPEEAHLIDAPIARDRHDARRMRVGPTGKPAQTCVACLGRADGHSLVSCELLTGRRHQIRVHMAHVGHPVVGDALYGHPAHGLMLHAAELEFVHPVTAEHVLLTTDWPRRFTAYGFLPAPDREGGDSRSERA